jgi:hypothetical protein
LIPSDDLLAQWFGLDSFDARINRGRLSDRSDALWVPATWRVDVYPNFDPPWVIAAFHSEKWHGQPLGRGPVEVKALVGQGARHRLVSLDEDPFARAFQKINFFDYSSQTFEDGISYQATLRTTVVRGQLSFSNPRLPSLRRVEAALFSLAQRVIPDSAIAVRIEQGEGDPEACLQIWRRYL